MVRGANTDYLDIMGVAECKRTVQRYLTEKPWHEDQQTGCWLFDGHLNPEGYHQFKVNTDIMRERGETGKNTGRNFLLHKVAYVAKHGLDVAGTTSHLCGRSNCFNGDHVVDETSAENNRRKGCRGIVICPEHRHQIVDLCGHQPKCIAPPPAGLQCCLSRAEAAAPPSSPPRPLSPSADTSRPSSSSSALLPRAPKRRRKTPGPVVATSSSVGAVEQSEAVQEILNESVPASDVDGAQFIVNDEQIDYDSGAAGAGGLAGFDSNF